MIEANNRAPAPNSIDEFVALLLEGKTVFIKDNDPKMRKDLHWQLQDRLAAHEGVFEGGKLRLWVEVVMNEEEPAGWNADFTTPYESIGFLFSVEGLPEKQGDSESISEKPLTLEGRSVISVNYGMEERRLIYTVKHHQLDSVAYADYSHLFELLDSGREVLASFVDERPSFCNKITITGLFKVFGYETYFENGACVKTSWVSCGNMKVIEE